MGNLISKVYSGTGNIAEALMRIKGLSKTISLLERAGCRAIDFGVQRPYDDIGQIAYYLGCALTYTASTIKKDQKY